jgi:hypothetical protein
MKIWTADDMNLYCQYITGNDNVKKSIKANSFFADRIGYLNRYVSKWQKLSDQEKVAFFNTDKHTVTNAFRVLQNADKNELTYVNGNLIIQDNESIDDTGYDAITNAFTRLNNIASKKVSPEDGILFENSCKAFVDSVYKYHHEYQMLNASTKANTTAAIEKVLAKNPKQVDVKKHLKDLKIKFNDIANSMHKMASSSVGNEIAATAAGAVLTVVGIVFIVIGCFGPNPTLIAGGVGILTAAIFLFASGTPSLGDNIDVKALAGKMQDWCKDMNPLLDYMIAHLGQGNTGV